MDIVKVFGTNVRKYRNEKRISQEKLAELSGLHRTYISDIERFQRSIALENIQRLADALEVETYKLFLEKEELYNGEKMTKNELFAEWMRTDKQ